MKNFAFRVSSSYDETKEHLAALYELCDKVAIYQHDADEEISRTHIHGLLMTCSRGEDTIRNKFFKGKYDRSDYELKSKYTVKVGPMKVKKSYDVDEKYITYMSKGELDPMFFKGFTKEEIDDYKAQWKNHKEVKEDTKDEDEKEKKPQTVYEICADILKTELPDPEFDERSSVQRHWRYDQDEIVSAILAYHNKKRRAICSYKVRDYYDCILHQKVPNRYKEICLNLIWKRDRQ